MYGTNKAIYIFFDRAFLIEKKGKLLNYYTFAHNNNYTQKLRYISKVVSL